MSDARAPARGASDWTKAWVTLVLLCAAAGALGYGLLLASSREDTEAIESPLVLAVARQLLAGPWGLYGPYSGQNPLVLIHAPLYYHLAALLAWPLYRAGLEPVLAALVAGRSLSVVALLGTLLFAGRIARLDGAPRTAAWWAVFLIAATPLSGGMQVEVRPDLLGVFLQSAGVLLVLTVLNAQKPCGPLLLAAFGCFGLAFCVKQTFIASALVSAGLLLASWMRGRTQLGHLGRGLLLASLIVLVVYGTEEVATGGRMSQAVFYAAANVARIHPAGWFRAYVVGYALLHGTVGATVVLASAGLVHVWARPGLFWKACALVGILLWLVVVALVFLELLVESSLERTILTLTALCTAFVVVPLCALLERPPLSARKIDRALWIYLFSELAFTAFLCRASTGAWVNYAIQAVVFAGILAARALVRAVESSSSWRLFSLAIAVVLPLCCVYKYVARTTEKRAVERLALQIVLDHLKCAPAEMFFVDRPGDNRVFGRTDLVYDDWLYTVFESLHLAEPRSAWLARALQAGRVRYVINTSDRPRIDGLPQSLPRMGYVASIQVGPFYVWKRIVRMESE